MELRHLRYFIAVAEELHFSRAAQRLNISQPPLSQQIASLEQMLGVKLFDRDRRNVALTKAGEMFLLRARMILANADEAIEEAKRVDRGFEGKLTIGYMSALMLLPLSRYLREFRLCFPSAEVELRQKPYDEQYLAVMNGELDVGFIDFSMDGGSDTVGASKLICISVLHERMALCVAIDHPLASRSMVSIEDLVDVQFVAVKRHAFPTFFDDFVYLCRQHGFNPQVVQRVDSVPVVVAMVSAGYGAAIVPDTSIAPFAGTSRCIPIEERLFSDIFMISRAKDNTRLMESLREIAQASAIVQKDVANGPLQLPS